MTAYQITKYLHDRGSAVTAIIVTVAAIIVAFSWGKVDPIEGYRGILYPSPNLWISDPVISMSFNLLFIVGLAIACIIINKTFNIMRGQTAIWATFFLFFSMSMPSLGGQFYGGTLLCAVMVTVTALMFTCFGAGDAARRVFLMFFLLSITALVQYAAMFYLIVLFPGLAQMRVLNMKSIIAGLLGIICPLWIIFGCGIASPFDIQWPEFVGTLGSLDSTDMLITFSTLGITILLGIFAFCGVIMKVISYNAKYRSANGFWAILMMSTILLMLVDYNNLAIYVPLLNFTAGYHLAHFFSNHRKPRSFIPILSILSIYTMIYALSLYF